MDRVRDSLDNILDEFNELSEEFTDIVVIGLDDDRVVFIGDTGLFNDQRQSVLEAVCSSVVDS